MNVLKTTFFMAGLTLLFILVGGALGGQQGMVLAFVLACAMNLGTYWFSDRIVLRMYGAQEVSPMEAPELYEIVKGLAHRAGIPMPKLYIIPSEAPNAFATGRNPEHAAVAVTEGILRLLSRDELAGVLAHELSHVKHRDILIGTIAATIAGAISMLANMAQWAMIFGGGRRDDEDGEGGGLIGTLAMMILAPIAAMLIQMAISRSREYLADEGGAKLSHPRYLASALRKLQRGVERVPMAEATPATAHMFIVNPFRGEGIVRLFSTHPPLEERIQRLESMALRP
ncbi:MAG: zinc metalloprotease HtpX [Nitrospinae bacterium]|nr:zinc metalloprotease HtpX [Nitrospinota bacterium]